MDPSPNHTTAVFADIPDRRGAGSRMNARNLALTVGLFALAVCAVTVALMPAGGTGPRRLRGHVPHLRRFPYERLLGTGFHGRTRDDCVDRVFEHCRHSPEGMYECGSISTNYGCGIPLFMVKPCKAYFLVSRTLFKQCLTKEGMTLSFPWIVDT